MTLMQCNAHAARLRLCNVSCYVQVTRIACGYGGCVCSVKGLGVSGWKIERGVVHGILLYGRPGGIADVLVWRRWLWSVAKSSLCTVDFICSFSLSLRLGCGTWLSVGRRGKAAKE